MARPATRSKNEEEQKMTPEKNRLPGVYYALTDDGRELPIIDITHPAFSDADKEQKLADIARRFAALEQDPETLRRILSQRSTAFLGSGSAKFVSGMATYAAKLDPDFRRGPAGQKDGWRTAPSHSFLLQGTDDGLAEQSDGGFVGPLVLRKRLRDMAGLIAEELSPLLSARPGSTVHMLNIGGGPAMDSINALILLNRQHPKLLPGRRIRIHVLDPDSAGPNFGSRALTAVRGAGGPLDGLDVTIERVEYDWTDTSRLQIVTDRIDSGEAAIGSSEGALFAYGTDEVIVENLKVLRESTPRSFVMVGSIIPDGPLHRMAKTMHVLPSRAFDLDGFSALAGSAGWAISRATRDRSLHQVLSLKKK
jgi:hypothetical protein